MKSMKRAMGLIVGWRLACLLLAGLLACGSLPAQPIDIMVPDKTMSTEELLGGELRAMEGIARDIAIERLTQKPTDLDAMLELGQIRMREGKFDEAQRYFEMVIARSPNHMLANKGLAEVHMKSGRFADAKEIYDRMTQVYPISDALRREVERVRRQLHNLGEVGVNIREDSRGLQEVVGFIEYAAPSFTYPKLSGRFRAENWSFTDTPGTLDVIRFSGTGEYVFDHRAKAGVTIAPETINHSTAANSDIGGYDVYGSYGTKGFYIAAHNGRQVFKENVETVRARMVDNYLTLTLMGELHARTRLSQSVTVANLSDDNTRRRFDTELLHFIYRKGVPLLSIDVQLFQNGYERNAPTGGGRYVYWAPTDHRGANLTLGWERGIGSRWWWGVDTFAYAQTYRDIDNVNTSNALGGGFKAHISHRFDTGRLFAEFTNTGEAYYRERRLGVYGQIQF